MYNTETYDSAMLHANVNRRNMASRAAGNMAYFIEQSIFNDSRRIVVSVYCFRRYLEALVVFSCDENTARLSKVCLQL